MLPELDPVEAFLIAMVAIFAIPYLVWRLARTEDYAPLVVVQIVTGIVLSPGMLGWARNLLDKHIITGAGGRSGCAD